MIKKYSEKKIKSSFYINILYFEMVKIFKL